MAKKQLDPPAAALMESVRGVGYDAKTAVADLVDNSLAASAINVWLKFSWAGERSTITILDDGVGMDSDTLDRAMTFGGQGPGVERKPEDLGRFGLGLKTASLSQCRRLVVASRSGGGEIAIRIWDLDLVYSTNSWVVETQLREEERYLVLPLEVLSSGTLVIWKDLDRLVGGHAEDDEKARLSFQTMASEVEQHLAMTFHRFLEGTKPRFKLYMHGESEEFRVKPWDPFYRRNPATQILPEVRRGSGRGGLILQGAILPHKDRIPAAEFEEVGGPRGWLMQQGFYVYRNERLIVPGSWLGLGTPKGWGRDEQHKLARIRLDLPNSLDAEWSLDIKKSRARPPLHVKEWLTRIAGEIRRQAREVFVHRGNRATSGGLGTYSPIWLALPGLAPAYTINRENPLVAGFIAREAGNQKQGERLLRLLESSVPIHRIWLDVSVKPDSPPAIRSQLPQEQVQALAKDLIAQMVGGGKYTRAAAIARLRTTEPFDQFPEVLAAMEA